MSRPLLSRTAAELEQAVARNCDNAAELKLILAELRHRGTAYARQIERAALVHLARLGEAAAPPGTQPRSRRASAKPSQASPAAKAASKVAGKPAQTPASAATIAGRFE
jgi:hypothetical protein